MIKLRERENQRRSLLALARERKSGSNRSYPLWKVLLIANGTLVSLILVWSLFDSTNASLSGVMLSALLAVAYCTPITLLARLGSDFVQRKSSGRSRGLQGALLVATWMVSGVIGSALAYGAIWLASGGRLVMQSGLFTSMLAGNGVIAIGVGTFIFFFELINGRYRTQAEMLNQQDLLAAELLAARNVQWSLLPPGDILIAGFDISGGTEPAVEIGGDYYDYLSFADGTKGILIADAAGKGVPAALVMAKFQGMTQALSIHLSSPDEFLSVLDDTLKMRLDRRSFITVGMVTIDLEDRCTFYRAGNNPLLLYRAATEGVEISRPPGLALGLAIGTTVAHRQQPAPITMNPGDVALLYSDGLNEATASSGEPYGDERVAAALREIAAREPSAQAIRSALLECLAEFVGSAEPHDDITIVVIRKL